MCKLQVNTVVRVNYYLVFMLENTFPLNIEPIKNKPMMIGKINFPIFKVLNEVFRKSISFLKCVHAHVAVIKISFQT